MSSFENLLRVQAALDKRIVEISSRNKNIDPSFFCFARHHMLDKGRFGYDVTVAKNWWVIFGSFALLPIDVFSLLFWAKSSKNLIVSSDRYSAQGKCRYTSLVPSTENKSIELCYSMLRLRLGRRVHRLTGLMIFCKLISKFLFITVADPWRGSYQDYTFISSKRMRELYLEFTAHKIFWNLLIKLKRPKRVIFVSGAFYSPLVSVAKEAGVICYEVGHGLVHPGHPIYGIEKKCADGVADIYIDNQFAPLLHRQLVAHRKVIQTRQRKELGENLNAILNPVNGPRDVTDNMLSQILIIGQGGQIDEKLCDLATYVASLNSSSKSQLIFRPHPGYQSPTVPESISKSVCPDLNADISWSSVVVCSYSLVAIDALLKGKPLIILDDIGYQILSSLGLAHWLFDPKALS